jgi:hypothetical protein
MSSGFARHFLNFSSLCFLLRKTDDHCDSPKDIIEIDQGDCQSSAGIPHERRYSNVSS